MRSNKGAKGKNDEWCTPRDLWASWNEEFQFGIDAAATEANALCPRYFTKERSALEAREWATAFDGEVWRTAWLNPPYSNVRPFIAKAREQALLPVFSCRTVMLLKSEFCSAWWQDLVTRPAGALHGVTFDPDGLLARGTNRTAQIWAVHSEFLTIEVRAPRRRLTFEGAKDPATFPVALVILTPAFWR